MVIKMKNVSIKRRKQISVSEQIFNVINYGLLGLMALLVLYPLYFVVIASISDPNAIYNGEVIFLPKDISMDGYHLLFQDTSIWNGYWNTIKYTTVGTIINVILTVCAAYALSRKALPGRTFFSLLIVFTMFFSGGLIPTYILVQKMRLMNTMWAIILPAAVAPWNLIVARSFFSSSVPEELHEAAYLDGCSELRAFVSVVLPVSKAIIAIMVLFYAVGHWNSYFSAMIYLNDQEKYPLQLILRNLLIEADVSASSNMVGDSTALAELQRIADQIKYGAIIVSSVPVLILYPFVQKYFVQGVTIGSIKG